MGFTSQDDLINQISVNGKYGTVISNKTTSVAQVAGTWTNLNVFAGDPIANTYAGTSLTYVPTNDTSSGSISHGGNVSTATKHFLNAGASIFAAAGAPWVLMCVDQVGYIPVTGADVTSTASRVITMTALGSGGGSGDRYANGEGLRAYISSEVAPTAGGPNMTVFTYTNSAGTTGKTCPVTVSCAATPVAGNVIHTGNAANRYGPFIPLASGDTGIRDIENFTFTGGTAYTGSGQLVIHLVKPLFSIPIPANGIHSMTDFVNQLPSLPRIRDGAYLQFLLFQTGATTTTSPIFIQFDYGYGG